MRLFLTYRARHPNMILQENNWIGPYPYPPTQTDLEHCKDAIREEVERRNPQTEDGGYGPVDVSIVFFAPISDADHT